MKVGVMAKLMVGVVDSVLEGLVLVWAVGTGAATLHVCSCARIGTGETAGGFVLVC